VIIGTLARTELSGVEYRGPVPFVKVHDSGRDFVVARGIQRHLRWSQVARAVCPSGHGIGAGGLLVITGHQGPDFRVCAYDTFGGRTLLCDSAVRCAARAIHSSYGLRRLSVGMSRFRYDVEVTEDSVETVVPHQEVPTGPMLTRVPSTGGELGLYGLRVGTEHLVAFVDDVESLPERLPGLALARFTVAEVCAADAVRIRTFDGARQVRPTSADAVAAVAVAGYLGRTDRAAVRVRTLDGVTLRVRRSDGAGLCRVSGPGAIVCAGEFSWPFPTVR
jgi:diaminopimelate epimerase